MAGAAGIKAGQAYVRLGLDDRMTAGLKNAQARLAGFAAGVKAIGVGLRVAGDAVRDFGAGLTAIGTRVAGFGALVGAPLAAAVTTFAKVGDALDEMATRTGVSVEALSELGYAADLAGVDMITLESAIRKGQKAIVDAGSGTQASIEALDALGLSAASLKGLTPEEQLLAMGEAIAQIEDPAKRTAAAMDLWGRSGTQLLPLFADGAAGIDKLRKQARAFGITMSGEAAAGAADLSDALDLARRTVIALTVQVGAALGPVVKELAADVASVAARVGFWVQQNQGLILTIAKAAVVAVVAGAALIALGSAVITIGFGIIGLGAVVGVLGAALSAVAATIGAMLTPIGAVVAAVAHLAVGIAWYTGSGGRAVQRFGEQWAWLSSAVGDSVVAIREAMMAGNMGGAMKVLSAGLKVAWEAAALALRTAIPQSGAAIQKLITDQLEGFDSAWIFGLDLVLQTWTKFWASMERIGTRMMTPVWQLSTQLFGKISEAVAQLVEDYPDLVSGMSEAQKTAFKLSLETSQVRARASKTDGEAARDEAISGINAKEQADLAALTVDRDTALGHIVDEARMRREKIDAEAAAKLTGAEAELVAARAELDKAVLDVKASSMGPPRPRDLDPFPSMKGINEFDPDDLHRPSVAAQGAFNAAAVAGLQSGPFAAIETATKETARNTHKIAAAAQQGGLTFGP